jgi:hypothetical protein
MQRMIRAEEVEMDPMFPASVATLGVFSFLAVSVWSDNRRKEREAFYRSETLKRIAEGPGAPTALEFLREEDRLARRRRQERIRVGGLVTFAIGAAFAVFLSAIGDGRHHGVWTIGLIPLFTGLALLVYGYLLAPRNADGAAAK